ncbi:MAG: 50S ribosomal protein L18 [Nanoarchaeota archaeon]
MAIYKRKKQGRTDYKTRLRLVSSRNIRLVIRKSLKHITLQIIDYHEDGDKVIITLTSRELQKYGWNIPTGNIPSAYLTGLLLAKKAKGKKITHAILDIGLSKSHKGGVIYAALKGSVDGGLIIPYSDVVFPKEDRINGSHIGVYSKNAKSPQFKSYEKSGVKANELPSLFDTTKKKIMGS